MSKHFSKRWVVLAATVCFAPWCTAQEAGSDPATAAMAEFLDRQKRVDAITRPPRGPGFGALDGSAQVPPPAPGGDHDKCTQDRDGDRLLDCAETATGRYVGPHDTGTRPDVPDSDGDSISDGDEVLGTRQGLDLRALGASPVRRDLLIEVDWFDDANSCAPHSHRPSENTVAALVAMFAQAPLANPDGSSGLHLIIDFGQGGAFTGGNRVTGNAVLPGTFDPTYQDLKTRNFDARRRGYFHYALFAHAYDNGSRSSGYAELLGDDLMVTLGCDRVEAYVTSTFAHELGHNLGLHHGGFEACNGKPNYNSVMNYRYQFAGLDQRCSGYGDVVAPPDFSHGHRLPLDERAIDERLGMCGNPPIDWNANGTLEAAVAHDLNASFNGECGTAMRKLDDFDDWENVRLAGILDPSGSIKHLQQEVACAGAPPPPVGASAPARKPGRNPARAHRS